MAARKGFSFEEGASSSGPVNVKEIKLDGSLPDFSSFAEIDLGSVSPALGVSTPGVEYKPMNKGAEYLFDEEERTRSFGEHLVFYSGSSYLTGVIAGLSIGTLEGLRKGQNFPTNKLRLNAVVNACSKRAPMFGNNLGVLALFFTSSERLSMYIRDKDDTLNPVIGAASAGFFFKCTSGPRQCLLWTLMGGLGMGVVVLSGISSMLGSLPLHDMTLAAEHGASTDMTCIQGMHQASCIALRSKTSLASLSKNQSSRHL